MKKRILQRNQNPINMKKLFTLCFAFAAIASISSCSKCYVCTDKDSNTFNKVEVCDKDFDKGDVREAIEYYENLGATCHAKSRAF